MNNKLPEDKLNELLPGLKRLAELASAGNALNRQMISSVASSIGIDGEEWAIVELELWSQILMKALDPKYPKESVMDEFQSRGVQEFPAMLAYNIVARAFSVEPEEIDFGLLKAGEGDNKTLIVRGGGINKVLVNSQRLKVIHQKMGDGTISVKVQLSGGAAGESFHGELILHGDRGDLKVPVMAQWEKASTQTVPEQKELLLLLWCPNCQPKIKWKSLLCSKTTGMCRCSNCGREYSYDDKRVRQSNKPLQ